MAYLNTGQFELAGCTAEQLRSVADECQFLSLQDRFRESLPAPQPKPGRVLPYTRRTVSFLHGVIINIHSSLFTFLS
ncbi:hypothetical protein OESDEN_09604 [Oesophagostomum dentatum]|uniref:Uncharacterized protein n=1 Tax=Oesophagostomum dentatum TaxID=61180 RepID=A0A0B1T325_OESDE|nr:hypothetical protein OESDEN_09604 [Oesophagostomum dentatum]